MRTDIDMLAKQREALLTGAHVRRSPRNPEEVCLVMHCKMYPSGLNSFIALSDPAARQVLRAIGEMDFHNLKQAIRAVRIQAIGFVCVRWVPGRVAGMYNDYCAPSGFNPVSILDRALIFAKEEA